MNQIENDFMKYVHLTQYSKTKNHFLEYQVDFWTKEFTLKTEKVKFSTSSPQVVLQDIKKSFEGAHWDAKNYWNSPVSL